MQRARPYLLGIFAIIALGLIGMSLGPNQKSAQTAAVGSASFLSISANNAITSTSVPSGSTAQIRWLASGVKSGSCKVYGDGNWTGWAGESNPGYPDTGLPTDPVISKHVYELRCTALDGSVVSANVIVNVQAGAPTTVVTPPPPTSPTNPAPVAMTSGGALQSLPTQYIYNVLSKNPNAPWPGNRMEFFISLNGSDAPNVTGLTPQDAFRTGQHCVDYVYSHYYIGGSQAEVFCRYMGTGTAQPAVYNENVQPTGNIVGAQGIAGGIVTFVGTMPLDGPWDSQVGGYYKDFRDVVVDSSKTQPYHCGTNLTAKPCTTFSGVNGTVFQILGLSIKSAPGFAAVTAASPGTVIAVGSVALSGATVGLQAASGGQVIVIEDVTLDSPIKQLVDVQGLSSFHWVGGMLHLKNSDITTFATITNMSYADFGGLKFDSNTGHVLHSCVVNANSVLTKSGATLPGPGSCSPSSGAQLLP